MSPWAFGRRALPVLLLLIEATWLMPWSHLAGVLLRPGRSRAAGLLQGDLAPLVADALVVGTLVAAYGVRRVTPARRSAYDDRAGWSRRLATLASVAGVAGGASASLRMVPLAEPAAGPSWFQVLTGGHEAGALLVTVAFLGITWWRGAATGATTPGDRHAGRRAVVAGAAIAAASAVATAVLPSLLESLVPAAAAIAVPAMVGALALASLEESQLPRPGAPVGVAPDRTWLGMVVGLSTGVALGGAAIAFVLAGQAGAVIASLRLIGGIVGGAFVLFASIAVIPVLWFASWLAGMMRGNGTQPPDMPLSGGARDAFIERLEDVGPGTLLDPAVVEVLLALGALAIVALVAWRLLHASAQDDLDGAESEVRSSVFSWSSLFRRSDQGTADSPPVDEVRNPVRRAYRAFLVELARHGVLRARAETPMTLAMRLAPPGPGQGPDDADLRILTAAYERARYGPDKDGPPGAGPERSPDAEAVAAASRLAASASRAAERVRTS